MFYNEIYNSWKNFNLQLHVKNFDITNLPTLSVQMHDSCLISHCVQLSRAYVSEISGSLMSQSIKS